LSNESWCCFISEPTKEKPVPYKKKPFKAKDRVYDEPDLDFNPDSMRKNNLDPKKFSRLNQKRKQQREEVILFQSCAKKSERCYGDGKVQVFIV
jgi:hypothetical protein